MPMEFPTTSVVASARYRVYNSSNGHHHWMTSEAEYNHLLNVGWTGEGYDHKVLLEAATVDNIEAKAYYRLFNSNSGEHHWTMSFNEYSHLGNIGWVQEGIDGYIFDSNVSGTIALYRLYNPNSGFHHYSTSEFEYNTLGDAGWVQEGVSGYVFPLE